MLKENILFLFIYMTAAVKTPSDADFYLAAVVEYSPLGGNNSIMINAEEYITIIKEAADEADIIVFPEVGLFLHDRYQTFIEVPFGNSAIAPADDEKAHPLLQIISKEARNQGVYVVINVHEKYEYDNRTYHYNTNAVFNRSGNIIARYRKFNLFNEPLDVPSTPEQIYFDSDFGVRFGTFICFDILFEKPALELIKRDNVTDILYPTFWYSGLPFFTAVQTQAGWAYANDVNLLASGGNNAVGSNTGSGIYAGKKGPVVYLQSQKNETTILYGKVYKKGRRGTSVGSISKPTMEWPRTGLKLWGDLTVNETDNFLLTPQIFNPSSFKRIPNPDNPDGFIYVKSQILQRSICQDKYCCHLDGSVNFSFIPVNQYPTVPFSNSYLYRFALFDGIANYFVRDAGVQYCSVISCLNSSLDSCGKPLLDNSSPFILPTESFGDIVLFSTVFQSVSIKAVNLEEEAFVFPTILELSRNPDVYGSLMNVSQFSFDLQKTNCNLHFSSAKLITGGIYSRVFSRDNSVSSALNSTYVSLLVLLTSLCCFSARWAVS